MKDMNMKMTRMSMNCKNSKIKDENLRNLLVTCTYNIKGLTPKKIIEEYLPIKVKNLDIYIQNDTIFIEKDNEKVAEIWTDTNCYSNLEILKNITPIFGIKCKDNSILELMKYRNKIILILL